MSFLTADVLTLNIHWNIIEFYCIIEVDLYSRYRSKIVRSTYDLYMPD